MAYFPFMIDVENKNCLVVGGGEVALRKIRILLDFDVNVVVVADKICEELESLAKEQEEAGDTVNHNNQKLALYLRRFCDEDLDGADIVIAATSDRKLNLHISRLCREKHILMNAVDMKEACSFVFPAMIKQGELVVSVSTGGNSPGGAAYIKRQIEKNLPDYYGDMIENLGNIRQEILEKVDHPDKRKKIFHHLLVYGEQHHGNIPGDIVQTMIEETETL